jgi:transcriptional regulator with XRE-family HTH domain
MAATFSLAQRMHHHFTNYLRDLRHHRQKSIEAVAQEAGVSSAALYKAESGKPVSWTTIEKAYAPLCPDKSSLVRLLARWSLSKVRALEIDPVEVEAEASRLCDHTADYIAKNPEINDRINRILLGLTPPQRHSLIRFAESFAQSEHTREMAEAWLKATNG